MIKCTTMHTIMKHYVFYLSDQTKILLITFFHIGCCSYIIPVPVIKHFISGVEENGKYIGFCSLGLSCQTTENVQLRNHFSMRPDMTGVLVSKINPLSGAYKILKKDDVILSFDGVPIANDGTGVFLLFFLLNFRLYNITV